MKYVLVLKTKSSNVFPSLKSKSTEMKWISEYLKNSNKPDKAKEKRPQMWPSKFIYVDEKKTVHLLPTVVGLTLSETVFR